MSEEQEAIADVRDAFTKGRTYLYTQTGDIVCNIAELLAAYDTLRTQLAAEREAAAMVQLVTEQMHRTQHALTARAEAAERKLDALQKFVALQDAWETEAMGDITTLLRERNEYRHRAERLGQQLDAVRSLCDDMQDYTALKVLEQLDDASAGEG